MKHYMLYAGIILGMILFSGCQKDKLPTTDLSGSWKFQPGDNLQWKDPAFNDSAWVMVRPDLILEKQGFEHFNGIGWYRIAVEIPSALQKGSSASDSLQFILGKIDDCDQVFLNGELIGENGKSIHDKRVPDSSFTKTGGIWDMPRKYKLSRTDPRIRWDEQNVIAVRCFDHGGDGGMYDKNFHITMTSPSDWIKFDFNTYPYELKDSLVTKKIVIRNNSSKEEFRGKLHILVREYKSGITLLNDQSGILLTQGVVLEKSIAFQRASDIPVIVQVDLREEGTGRIVSGRSDVPYLLTPPPLATPRINGASIFGARPYSPVLYKIAATGEPPLTYSADSLPEGLLLNSKTGMITGMLKKKGDYRVLVRVENSTGKSEKVLTIRIGDLISLTPPLGWNSWNCWGLSVSDQKIRQSAENMVSSGLSDHGWTYINIDDGWQDTHDKDGNILPNYKFPDMKRLSDHVHSLGLKIGIYSSPGPKTCGGYEGSYKFEEKDAQMYASWGIDYLKHDWCSYFSIAPDPTIDQLKRPYKEMRQAIRRINRDIHYSLCQYGMGKVWEWGTEVDGNSWRTTGDIVDTWESMSTIGFSQTECAPWAAPGRWNDPDMLVVGWVGWGPSLHYTRLTPDEQYTHISLWSLLASPLLIGCDLSRLDPFTMNLLTNDEVLAVNQDPLGQQATLVAKSDKYQVWARDLADGGKAVGLFNLTEEPLEIPVDMKRLCLEGKYMLRDLWRQKDLGQVRDHFEMRTQPHGTRMVTLTEL